MNEDAARITQAGNTQRSDGIVPVGHSLGESVALWRVDLDAFPVGRDAPVAWPGIVARARRLPRQAGRRLLAAHSASSAILAEVLNCDPVELRIERDPMGRPVLTGHRLSFNLSISGGQGLVGLAAGAHIGVDLEVLRSVAAADGIAAEHFSADELASWRAAAAEERKRCFLRCWTRKEACAKSLGVGLRIPPAMIDAGCGAATRHAGIHLRGGLARCRVTSVDPGHRLLGAVAVASDRATRLAAASVAPQAQVRSMIVAAG